MEPTLIRTPKQGDEILAMHFADLKEAICEATIRPGSCAGIDVFRGPGGTTLSVQPPSIGSLGVVTSAISARVGTTLGTGLVELYYASSTGVATDCAQAVNVYNFSSTTGGITTGLYVWVQQDPSGDWYVTAIDCGN